MKTFWWWFFETLAVISAGLLLTGGVFYGTSVTTISTTLDGEPLNGAVVKVDGKKVGKTPYRARWFLERHTVEVFPPRRLKTTTKKCRHDMPLLRFGGTHEICEFTSRYLILDISAKFEDRDITGAIVEIDGKVVGKTPYTSEKMDMGAHQVTVTAPRNIRSAQPAISYNILTVGSGGTSRIVADFHKP